MLRLNMKNFLLSAILAFAPVFATADQVADVVNDVAAKLVDQLPMDKKIALKSLSPDETGLPEDFLRKLTSDLEAALLTASEFEINIANRTTMEDVWQEAIEFNNADFNELFKSANADVMLMMSPRAISTGVEIAITAYSLTGDNVGKTLASSGSVLLPIDLQANLGVDVNDLNKQMAQVLAEIEKVGQTGGLITNANTYAEFYHNARLLQQRGEVDLAMRNYEQALAEGYLFVDPLLDLLDLANARYGEAGTKKYFEKRIKDNIPRELADLGSLVLGSDPIALVQPILDGKIKYSPLLLFWLQTDIEVTFAVDKARYLAAKISAQDYNTGKFQSFYIDKIRGASVGEAAVRSFKYENEYGRNKVSRTTAVFDRVGPYSIGAKIQDFRPYVKKIEIRDSLDLGEPIILCGRISGDTKNKCRELYAHVNQNSTGVGGYRLTNGRSMEWTAGMHCLDSITYTDINGFRTETPIFIDEIKFIPDYHKKSKGAKVGVLLSDYKKIVECAKELYHTTK